MTTHAFEHDNAKQGASSSFSLFKLLTLQRRRPETFDEYVKRVDSVLDSPEVTAKVLALKPARKLPRR